MHSRREENVGMDSKLPMIGGSSATFKSSLLVSLSKLLILNCSKNATHLKHFDL